MMYKVPGTVEGGPGSPPEGCSGSTGPSPLSGLEEGYFLVNHLLDGISQVGAGVQGRHDAGGWVLEAAREGVLEDS